MSKQTPQVEDGFVRIASELYDAILLADFSKRELLVLMAIIRKTYGFNKKEDDLTNSQIAKATGLTAPHASETVSALEARGVIATSPGKFGKVISVQKNYRKWADAAPAKPASKGIPKTGTDSRNGIPETGRASRIGIPETGTNDSRNGNNGFPKRELGIPETGHTIDNPNRQLQKTTPIDCDGLKPTAAVWDSYSSAYTARYGHPPVRNQKVNGQLKNLIERLGAEAAPHVAAWYVRHNSRRYVEPMHSVAFLLMDAEKLHTEWATNTRVTTTSAMQADRTQAAGQVWLELMQENAASEH